MSRAFPVRGHSAIADAGVGDQEDNTCRNGTPRCPGPDSDAAALPCAACFLEAEDDQDDERELVADGGTVNEIPEEYVSRRQTTVFDAECPDCGSEYTDYRRERAVGAAELCCSDCDSSAGGDA
jgi:hypothetical protein